MPAFLLDLFQIEKGTLFKGIKSNQEGHTSFSVDGWELEEKRIIKNIWMANDHNKFLFTYYKNKIVQEYLKAKKIEMYNEENFSYDILRKNGSVFDRDFNYNSFHKSLNEGDLAGMSLGENFCILSPTTANIYRPDFYKIFTLHKVLFEDEIIWVAFQSKHLTKQNIILKENLNPLNILIQLV